MTDRRAVRVLPELFILLDEQLPHERGPHGEPTAAEFAASDLLDIVDTFATRWDQLPAPIPGRSDYRVLILTGRLVHAAAVRGQLSPLDGAIELIDIAIDLYGPAVRHRAARREGVQDPAIGRELRPTRLRRTRRTRIDTLKQPLPPGMHSAQGQPERPVTDAPCSPHRRSYYAAAAPWSGSFSRRWSARKVRRLAPCGGPEGIGRSIRPDRGRHDRFTVSGSAPSSVATVS